MNTDKSGFRRIMENVPAWIRRYSDSVILSPDFESGRRISEILRSAQDDKLKGIQDDKARRAQDARRGSRHRWLLILLILPFLLTCAASTDWNNPCDPEASNYSVTECAKKQQSGGSQCEWCGRVVNDLNGGPLPGATITLSSSDTRVSGRENVIVETDGSGCIDFSFDTSSISYSVTVTMTGYQDYETGTQTWGCHPGEKEIRLSPTSPGAPSAPSVLTAAGGASFSLVDLVWQDNSNNEDGFEIERKTGSGGTYVQIRTVVQNVTTYQDTGLTCETEYYYRVRAYNSAGDSDYTSEANVTTGTCSGANPSAPTAEAGPDQSNVTKGQYVTLDGTGSSDPNGDPLSYSWRFISQPSGANEQFYYPAAVTGFYAHVPGLYVVELTVSDGSYEDTDTVTITVLSGGAGLLPTAPSNFIAVGTSIAQIDLTWKDNSNNEDGFKIERKIGSGGTYSLIYTASSNATTYSDTGLSADTIYYYRVYAYNSAGNSGYSNEVFGATMASIPAGCFNMGDAFSEGNADELPVHNVCISTFQMDVYEVTNAQYKQCVDSGICTAPGNSSSYTRSSYYGNATYDNYPVIYVNWSQANTYCNWIRLKRLPTEAEWEYAARGGLAGKRYPRGDSISCSNANYGRDTSSGACYNYGGLDNDTQPAGSYSPNGYGLYDMAGNVWNWTQDWYGAAYYSSSPTSNPQGPSSGSYRAVRGGAWNFGASNMRAAGRGYVEPYISYSTHGFRCAK